MHVLHIYKDYPPVIGGIENHLRLLAEAQARRGLDVTVLVTSPHRSTTVRIENGVRVIRAGRWATISSAPLSTELFRWVHRLSVDITHLQFPYPIGELAHLTLGHSRATVITYQSDIIRQRWLGRLYRPFLWQLLHRADRIIATSPQYIESSPYLQQVADKCVVVPLAIDPAPFLKVDPQQVAEIRTRFGGPLLLFVGRLRYYKGLEYLLQAMHTIDATLLVIGSGPMQARWQRLARNCAPAGCIHFLGDVPDDALPAYYAAADVFVLPASHRSEAYGLVQLEAMAAGTPVVSTAIGTGTSFVNRHGETGFVVPPRDPAALAEAVNRLLGDARLRRVMGEQGRQRVLTEFSVDRMVDRVIEVYRAVLTHYLDLQN